jgi:putative intracellular protease/amidase
LTLPVSRPVLIVLPKRDFDPSEVAVTWKVLGTAGNSVIFATPDGLPAAADPLMLSGEELDLSLRIDQYDGLVLPGGHWARGMRQYLEDPQLQRFVGDFFDADQPVAAICHGVVLAARSVSRHTGRSVLHGRKSTALTWRLERAAWSTMRYVGRVWDPAYYRTYLEADTEPLGYRSVQAEVTRALASPSDFCDVPKQAGDYFRKTSGLFRDSDADRRPAWVVCDRRYVSARWPGDANAFAAEFARVLADFRASSIAR